MLNNKEKEVVKNYYLEDYINTIRYILTFDEDVNNKYSVYIENKISYFFAYCVFYFFLKEKEPPVWLF